MTTVGIQEKGSSPPWVKGMALAAIKDAKGA